MQIKSKEEKGKEVSGGRETRSKRQTKRMIKKCRDRKKIIWREKKLQRAISNNIEKYKRRGDRQRIMRKGDREEIYE